MTNLPFPQSAINPEHRGFLRRQLRIRADEIIPEKFLKKIVATPIGLKAKNPTKTGVKIITVTRLVHQRALLALVFRGFNHGGKTGGKKR